MIWKGKIQKVKLSDSEITAMHRAEEGCKKTKKNQTQNKTTAMTVPESTVDAKNGRGLVQQGLQPRAGCPTKLSTEVSNRNYHEQKWSPSSRGHVGRWEQSSIIVALHLSNLYD